MKRDEALAILARLNPVLAKRFRIERLGIFGSSAQNGSVEASTQGVRRFRF